MKREELTAKKRALILTLCSTTPCSPFTSSSPISDTYNANKIGDIEQPWRRPLPNLTGLVVTPPMLVVT